MPKGPLLIGQDGERIALRFLKDRGYKIITTNYSTKIGQVDIVARDGKTICFVEVKTRSNYRFGYPKESIGSIKQQKLSKLALLFLKKRNMLNQSARFDVVSVSFINGSPKVDLIKDAFRLDTSYIY